MIRSFAYLVHFALMTAATALVWVARERPRARGLWIGTALIAVAAVGSFAIHSWGRATPFGDFDKAYYRAGVLVLTAPERLYSCDVDILCFVNIPIVAALFAPLSELPLVAARVVFTMIGSAAVGATVWLLLKITGARRWRAHAIVAIAVLNGPLYYSARLGNLSHVLLLPLMLALVAFVQRRDRTAGAWLAIIALIKPPMLIFMPYLLLRRRWAALAAMSLTMVGVVILSIAWLGLDLHRTWVRDYVIGFGARPVAAYNVQSISGALARFTTPGHTTDWRPLDVDPLLTAVRYALTLLCMAGAVAACAMAGRPRSDAAWWNECSIVLLLGLLASPITWTHYYCVLIIPLCLYVCGGIAVPRRRPWVLAWSLASVLITLPVVLPRPTTRLFAELTERVLLSHYVAGGIVLLAILQLGLLATRDRADHEHLFTTPAAGT